MKFYITVAALFAVASAIPSGEAPQLLPRACPAFDPAGAKNVGNGVGTQFIGGQCLSQADCASGCCANPCGICSGVGASTQAGKTGCGFGGSSAASNSGSGSGSSSSSSNTCSNAAKRDEVNVV